MLRISSMRIVAALVAVLALASAADALIEGPGVYYGLELPEPFYNYWNYTTDIKEMHNLYERNRFSDAAKIYLLGKNNRRNETAMRIIHDFTFRDLSIEGPDSFWGVYTKHFNSLQYLKDLIDPPLYGNGSYTGACCGVRSAALDVYLRLWQIAFAQHELDIGVALGAVDEATHGFAVVASPVDESVNYWKRQESYGAAACIKNVKDKITGENYARTNMAYRDGCKKMEAAIAANNENPDTGAAQVAEVRAEVEREILIQFMQVMMVEARKASQRTHMKNTRNMCYKTCLKGAGFQSGAQAAWKSIQPLVARSSDTATISKIDTMLKSNVSTWNTKTFLRALAAEVEKLAGSLGVNFKSEVWGC